MDLTATLSPAVAGKTIEFYINGESKGSGATLASGVATLNSVALTVGGVPLTVGTYTGTYNTSGVGASFAGDATYEPSTGAADLTVNQKELTVSGITADDKTYDGNTDATIHTGSAALEGVVGSDNVTLNTGAAAGAFAAKNVDTGITVLISGLTLNGAAAGNYFLTAPTASASITARDLTVTATGIEKVYDGTTVATVTLGTDALGGDNVTALYGSASFADANAGNGKAVSVSGISITGSDAGNYNLLSTTDFHRGEHHAESTDHHCQQQQQDLRRHGHLRGDRIYGQRPGGRRQRHQRDSCQRRGCGGRHRGRQPVRHNAQQCGQGRA